MKAKGILKHHFWGEYFATIILKFEDEISANNILKYNDFNQWKIGKNPNVLVWHGNSEALDKVKIILANYGADIKKIDSVNKSIDYGEPFEIDVKF
jgi:hypothetical protein